MPPLLLAFDVYAIQLALNSCFRVISARLRAARQQRFPSQPPDDAVPASTERSMPRYAVSFVAYVCQHRRCRLPRLPEEVLYICPCKVFIDVSIVAGCLF